MISNTTPQAPDHIDESIIQILLTRLGERPMESMVGSNCYRIVFQPNEPATHALLRYYIADALTRLEPRIRVSEDSIIITEEENIIYAEISYLIIDYGSSYTQIFELGTVA